MKTTLELPEELLSEAKAVAARRRITLKQLFTRALEKELRPVSSASEDSHCQIDRHGWPVYDRPDYSGPPVGDELVQQLREKDGI